MNNKKMSWINDNMGLSRYQMRRIEEAGLMPIDETRNASGDREYSPEQIQRLRKIIILKALGLTLKEIKRIIDDSEYDYSTTLICQKLTNLERKINRDIENLRYAKMLQITGWRPILDMIDSLEQEGLQKEASDLQKNLKTNWNIDICESTSFGKLLNNLYDSVNDMMLKSKPLEEKDDEWMTNYKGILNEIGKNRQAYLFADYFGLIDGMKEKGYACDSETVQVVVAILEQELTKMGERYPKIEMRTQAKLLLDLGAYMGQAVKDRNYIGNAILFYCDANK